jgi:homoserine kinase
MTNSRMVTVEAPATTANLGPGFDCLGIALGLYNRVQLRQAARPVVEVFGEGVGSLPEDSTNLTYRAAQMLGEQMGYLGHWHLIQRNRIPLARGMGSSSAAIVGGIVAAQAVLGCEADRDTALELAIRIEGHADNVAPALFGGLTICFQQRDGTRTALSLPPPSDLVAVVAIPDFQVNTTDARAAMPEQVPLSDAVFNLSQTAATVAMLTTGQYDLLADAMCDRLHQPYRAHLVPGMDEIIATALAAGARGAALSGSGSTIIALASPAEAEQVQTAVLQVGLDTTRHLAGMILPFDHEGARVVR